MPKSDHPELAAAMAQGFKLAFGEAQNGNVEDAANFARTALEEYEEVYGKPKRRRRKRG